MVKNIKVVKSIDIKKSIPYISPNLAIWGIGRNFEFIRRGEKQWQQQTSLKRIKKEH